MTVTTTAIIATEEQAEAFMAEIKARAAARKAAAPARKPRVTKAERQLALMMEQYTRDVAANPNTTIWNPTTRNFDAYRDGAIIAQADSYLAAETARLAHLTRDADGVVAVDAPCATCQGTTVTGQYLATDPCPSCGARLCIYCDCRCQSAAPLPPVGDDGSDEFPPPPPALTDDEAAAVDALAAHIQGEYAAFQVGEFYKVPARDVVPAVVPVGTVVAVPGGDTWAVSELAPKPLPTCDHCDRPSISHTVRWCGCIIGENEPLTAKTNYDVCLHCGGIDAACPYCGGHLLPFELTAEDRAHDRAVLLDIERMAGVDDLPAVIDRLAA